MSEENEVKQETEATEKKGITIEKESLFRGTWQPTIQKPVFGAYQFLPTPLPIEPVRKKDIEETPGSPAKKVKEEETKPRERMTGPPPGVDVEFTVIDREKEYRSCIAADGTCYNNMGDIIGYLNFESFEAGSASENYLGTVVENRFDNVIQVRDHEDELVGYLDMGTHTIRNKEGGTVADFRSGGILTHSNGTYLGQFEGARGYHNMRELSLYLMLLDPGMCSDISG